MQPLTREEFVKKYAPSVVQITNGTGIFPETLFSQAILESQGKGSDGNYYPGLSKLSKDANNYFGIKADASWKGDVYNINTGEYTPAGKYYVIADNFRKYPTVDESFKDYVSFLQKNPRYKTALQQPTFEKQMDAIQAAGYATSPTYSTTLKSIGTKIKDWIPDTLTSITDTATNLLTKPTETIQKSPGTSLFILSGVAIILYLIFGQRKKR